MYRIPGTLKISKGITKMLLREAMQGILPDETRLRIKKTGWNAPCHIWFDEKAREQLLDKVRSKFFSDQEIYKLDVLESIIQQHSSDLEPVHRNKNHMMFLWQASNLVTWLHSLKM